MTWNDLSPEARDFIIRVTADLLERTGCAADDFLVDKFEAAFQAPEKRVVSGIRKLAKEVERVKRAPTQVSVSTSTPQATAVWTTSLSGSRPFMKS